MVQLQVAIDLPPGQDASVIVNILRREDARTDEYTLAEAIQSMIVSVLQENGATTEWILDPPKSK